MKNIGKFLEKALDKMFQAVGEKEWDREFTKQEDWYLKKTWTLEQREEFKNWFLEQIKKDLKVDKVSAEKEWAWFDMMWGWKEETK